MGFFDHGVYNDGRIGKEPIHYSTERFDDFSALVEACANNANKNTELSRLSEDCVLRIKEDGRIGFSGSTTNVAYSKSRRTPKDEQANNRIRRELLTYISGNSGASNSATLMDIINCCDSGGDSRVAKNKCSLEAIENKFGTGVNKVLKPDDFLTNGKPLTLRRVRKILDFIRSKPKDESEDSDAIAYDYDDG